jgi:hypothetical protein
MPESTVRTAARFHHVIHDTDRDGRGSAALLAAQLGPASCVLHPMRGKDVIGVLAKLPADDRPTTTMRLLVDEGIVTLRGAMDFVAGLCRRSPPFEWGLVFDAMRDEVCAGDDLATLIARGPLGQPVPDVLRPLAEFRSPATA